MEQPAVRNIAPTAPAPQRAETPPAAPAEASLPAPVSNESGFIKRLFSSIFAPREGDAAAAEQAPTEPAAATRR